MRAFNRRCYLCAYTSNLESITLSNLRDNAGSRGTVKSKCLDLTYHLEVWMGAPNGDPCRQKGPE